MIGIKASVELVGVPVPPEGASDASADARALGEGDDASLGDADD